MRKGSTVLILIILLGACRFGREAVAPEYNPDNSVEDYIASLKGLNLDETRLGGLWVHWAKPELNLPGLSLLPFHEMRHFDEEIPEAAYYLFEGVRGHRITISISSDSDLSYFADLFGTGRDYNPLNQETATDLTLTASAYFIESDRRVRKGDSRIIFEPGRDRFYVLRIIPRLLEGGVINLQIETRAIAELWPVENTGSAQIWSYFGEPRDGGERVHHGVDIFAPRGTPIYSPVKARVARIGERPLGGLTVSLRDDESGITWYFAHLDSYGDLEENQILEAGYKIGAVGNTGNASTTPPHLHLGIYDQNWRTPLDPWYFLAPLPSSSANTGKVSVTEVKGISLGTRKRYEQLKQDYPDFVLYPSPAGKSPVILSPSRRNALGRIITPEEKPILSLPWQGEINPLEHLSKPAITPPSTLILSDNEKAEATDTLRMVALRENALGFSLPNGKVFWYPLLPD